MAFSAADPFVSFPHLRASASSLLRDLIEIPELRRWLILPRGHKGAVRALEIALAANEDVLVVLGAMILDPGRVTVALVTPHHRPRARQGVVESRELVTQDVRIGLVKKYPLLHHRLIVLMQGNAARVENAGTLQAAGLDFEHVVAAISVLIDPMADRITGECWCDRFRPGAAIGVDATMFIEEGNVDVGHVRRDDDLHRLISNHHPGHAAREATNLSVVVLPTVGPFGHVCLPNGLMLRRQWRLLCPTGSLARIK